MNNIRFLLVLSYFLSTMFNSAYSSSSTVYFEIPKVHDGGMVWIKFEVHYSEDVEYEGGVYYDIMNCLKSWVDLYFEMEMQEALVLNFPSVKDDFISGTNKCLGKLAHQHGVVLDVDLLKISDLPSVWDRGS